MFRFCFVSAVIVSLAAYAFGDTPKETKPEETLTLTINAQGELVREGKEPLKEKKEIKEYIEAEVKALIKRVGAEKAVVILRADPMLKYIRVVEILQMCKDVGIERVHPMSTEDEEKK